MSKITNTFIMIGCFCLGLSILLFGTSVIAEKYQVSVKVGDVFLDRGYLHKSDPFKPLRSRVKILEIKDDWVREEITYVDSGQVIIYTEPISYVRQFYTKEEK